MRNFIKILKKEFEVKAWGSELLSIIGSFSVIFAQAFQLPALYRAGP
jgi:hypothetical protein